MGVKTRQNYLILKREELKVKSQFLGSNDPVSPFFIIFGTKKKVLPNHEALHRYEVNDEEFYWIKEDQIVADII